MRAKLLDSIGRCGQLEFQLNQSSLVLSPIDGVGSGGLGEPLTDWGGTALLPKVGDGMIHVRVVAHGAETLSQQPTDSLTSTHPLVEL